MFDLSSCLKNTSSLTMRRILEFSWRYRSGISNLRTFFFSVLRFVIDIYGTFVDFLFKSDHMTRKIYGWVFHLFVFPRTKDVRNRHQTVLKFSSKYRRLNFSTFVISIYFHVYLWIISFSLVMVIGDVCFKFFAIYLHSILSNNRICLFYL